MLAPDRHVAVDEVEDLSKFRRISSRQIQLSQAVYKYTGNRKTKEQSNNVRGNNLICVESLVTQEQRTR